MGTWGTAAAARASESDDRIAALFAEPLPLDGWGNRVSITVLDRDDSTGIARLGSLGPDGLHGTLDDLSATLSPDGTLAPLLTAAERPDPAP